MHSNHSNVHEGHKSPFGHILLGLIILGCGVFLLFQLLGIDVGFSLPTKILEYAVSIGCIIGGFHMIWKSIFKHRIVLY